MNEENRGKKIAEIYHIRRNTIVFLAFTFSAIWVAGSVGDMWIPGGGLDIVAYATGGFFWIKYFLEALPGLNKPAHLVLYKNGIAISNLGFWKWPEIDSYGPSPHNLAHHMGLGPLSDYNLTLLAPPEGISQSEAKKAGAKIKKKKIDKKNNLITLRFYFPIGTTNIRRFSFVKQVIYNDKGNRKSGRELAELNADLKKLHANRKA